MLKDNKQIVGQTISDKTYKDIATELNRIEPYAKIDVGYIKISDEKYVIIFLVNPGDKAPYTYDGRPFIRNQSTTRKMTREEYVYLHNQNSPTLWESLTKDDFKINDLDKNRIKEIIRMAVYEKRLPESALSERIPEVLKKIGLLKNDKLTNAAIILFCKKEDKQLFQSQIQLARFRGNDKSEFINNKMFKLNAFDLYEKAMDFLHFHLPVAAKIEDRNPIRVETPTIPYKILREAITNALIHRDYNHLGGSISIAIYDDRLNISNIGALPLGIQINQLSKEHPSILRNPLIANVFYLCGKIEKWGRGTLDIIKYCNNSGNPIPIYEEIGGSFSITLPFKEPISNTINNIPIQLDSNKITSRQKDIINVLELGPLNREQIMIKVKFDISPRTLQLDLNKLKVMGLIKPEGKAKNVIWVLNDRAMIAQ